MRKGTVAVLGAGLQGACVALALARRGHRVQLVDQTARPMLRASLRNEGKLHLGFVYANDPSFRTAELMLEAALSFGPLLDGWVPAPIDWPALRSRPFTYLVMRDTLVATADIRAHYERLASRYRDGWRGGACYAGSRPGWFWRAVDTPPFVDPAVVDGAFETEEVAVDLVRLRRAVVDALDACEGLSWHPRHRVEGVARLPGGLVVEGRQLDDDTSWRMHADVVVNCLWEGRLAVDRKMGAIPERPWVHRLKYRILGRLPDALKDLPALTLTLGPYGDIVPLPDGAYFSWYPACRRGWSAALHAPRDWDDPCNGVVEPALERSLSAEALAALDAVVPGIRESRVTAVDAGIVFSWGETDIDRSDSRLHERFDVGVHGGDGYYSIDTGKLTCAPLFADRLAHMLA